jgi:hypothetical protein
MVTIRGEGELLLLISVSSFCARYAGEMAPRSACPHNGRFMLVLREGSDTGQFAGFYPVLALHLISPR